MRIVQISHAQSADPAVMANVARFLLSLADVGTILHADRPDVGATPLPLAEVPTAAALAFGGTAPQVGAPSTAAVAVPPIAQASLIPLPPVPTAPVLPGVPVAVTATPPAPVETDKAGLPWDARIHASSKAVNKSDGLWRQKRDTDPALVAQVEAQLRNAMGIVAPPPVAVPTPPINSVFALGAAAAPPAEAAPADFGSLMLWATPLTLSGKLTTTALIDAVVKVGLTSLNDLIVRPDLVPAVHAAMVAALTP